MSPILLQPEVLTLTYEGETIVLEVAAVGVQGPPGIPGSGGGSGIQIPFGYGDASPRILTTVTGLVKSARILILTPFNGASASLKLGDSGNSERLISMVQNDPSAAGAYGSNPLVEYATPTPVLLTIGLGSGANQGNGVVILEV